MTSRGYSLRVWGMSAVAAAFLLGLGSAWLWMQSTLRWNAHLNAAYVAGIALYDALRSDGAAPRGTVIADLAADQQTLADRAEFGQLAGIPRPALVTNVPVLPRGVGGPADPPVTFAIISSDLRYPVAGLTSREDQTPAETVALLTRTLAAYCSDPVIFAKAGNHPWRRITGPGVWDCAAAPDDHRLLAALLTVAAIGALSTLVLNTSARFSEFAEALRNRQRLGGPDSYEAEGPRELREIVSAVNSYLEAEREQLEKRAVVLSGVSHDLGTPATRLRLRAALIEDPALRGKLEADIDRMTGIIESVLTYTRTELNSEAPRQLSLTSLIDAVVADYQDTGRPVDKRRADRVVARGGQSLFMSRRGEGSLPDDRRIVVTARPVALERAVSNLIDNALKYGRRATVGLETDAEIATITVEDEGAETSARDVETLIAPFRRGDNTRSVDGYGLGLTIAASVAAIHGGALGFEPGVRGLRAKLTIRRQ